MMFETPEIWLHKSPPHLRGGIDVRIVDRNFKQCVTSLSTEPLGVGETIPVLMRIDDTQAQRMMDELWDCGIRPTQGAGSAGSLAATQAHLEDMRSIAMDLIKSKLVVDGGK